MDKVVIFMTLWSLSNTAYISRMSTIGRFRGPSAFRPGVVLQRPPFPPRVIAQPSHRTPFVVYRNIPHRYAVKPMMSPVVTRNVFGIPWKTTAHIPAPYTVAVTPEYDFARAALSQPVIRTDGAIHTIPAPNLSLSEKPIVVADTTDAIDTVQEQIQPTYEVTENNGETQSFKVQTKIEAPSGFSKSNSAPSFEYNTHNTQNDAAQQFNPEYVQVQTPQSIVPQEFSIQRFNGLPSHQDLIQSGAEGLIIPPNAFSQSDPLFLEKLHSQLLQKYPAVEFIPYTPNVPTDYPVQTQQFQPTQFYFDNGQIVKQQPMSFIVADDRHVVQRQTEEGTVVSLSPQNVETKNLTELNTPSPNVTAAEITTVNAVTEGQISTTKMKIEENKSDSNRTNPMYYAQIGQSFESIIPSGFQSGQSNETSSTTEQTNTIDKRSDPITENTTISSTTEAVPVKRYLVNKVRPEVNEISKEYTTFLGSPFEKPAESVNIAYTILRASEKEPKVEKNGTVLAGQVVEASVTEDKEFHKERALLNKQPQKQNEKRSVENAPATVVKAKIPPKSKLTFDDKTGEPILRVYASYVDSPARKEAITTKLANLKHLREAITKRQQRVETVDPATVNDLAIDVNQFGLKIKAKNTDNIPILDEYNK